MTPPPLPPREINAPIYLLGDNHGYYEEVLDLITEKSIHDAVILHVGDGDEGCENWSADHAHILNEHFAARSIEYLSIRGNHSDPALFDGSVNLSHFKLLPDYTRLCVNGQSWLLIGGAISINRMDLVPGVDWWPAERFKLRRELLEPADVLVTHSGPSWIGPPCRNDFVEIFASTEMDQLGRDLIDELEIERALHDEVFRVVHPSHWYLGHFHNSETKHHQSCHTRILDVCELHLHQR